MTGDIALYLSRLQMMCGYFERNSALYPLYLPEYRAAARIAEVLNVNNGHSAEDFTEIQKIIDTVDLEPHKNDAHWMDYKIHLHFLLNLLRQNKQLL